MKEPSAPTIVVIGGGLSGLATAHAILAEAQRQGIAEPTLRVLESEDRPGGKIRTYNTDSFLCEWGPPGFLDREPATLQLCEDLQLNDQLHPAAAAFNKRFLYRDGQLHTITANPLSVALSPVLPLTAKLRVAAEPFVRKRKEQTDESVASFASRRIGKTAANILIDAMQAGIFAGDPQQLSVQSCFPRVVEIERDHGSLVRGMLALAKQRRALKSMGAGPSGVLTTFRNGMQTLTDALAQKLGERLELGKTVTGIEAIAGGSGYRVCCADGTATNASAVVLACPAHVAATVLRAFDTIIADELYAIDYAPVAVACLGFAREHVEHPLDGFGFLAPHNEGLQVLGTLFSSSYFDGRAPADHVLLRVMMGGARAPQLVDASETELIQTAYDQLQPILGLRSQPVFTRVFRHITAIPQYNIGHSDRLERIALHSKKYPGLLISGNALHGVGVNDCIKNASATAQAALSAIDTRASQA